MPEQQEAQPKYAGNLLAPTRLNIATTCMLPKRERAIVENKLTRARMPASWLRC